MANSANKMVLKVYLEGNVLVKRDKPDIFRVVTTNRDLHPNKKFINGDGEKVVKTQNILHYGKESIPAIQIINMNQEAYDHFISECPRWIKKRQWDTANEITRVHLHCQRICEHLEGTGYELDILTD